MKKYIGLSILVLLLILAGCNKGTDQNDIDKKRLDKINQEVASLFNDDQDDLHEKTNENSLKKVGKTIQEEIDRKRGLSKENEAYFHEINNQFELAQHMLETEERFASFLEDEEIDEAEFEKAKDLLDIFINYETYYKRMVKEADKIAKKIKEQANAKDEEDDETDENEDEENNETNDNELED